MHMNDTLLSISYFSENRLQQEKKQSPKFKFHTHRQMQKKKKTWSILTLCGVFCEKLNYPDDFSSESSNEVVVQICLRHHLSWTSAVGDLKMGGVVGVFRGY